MTIHFICRGNVLRSFTAEAYIKSLKLHDVQATSSGTNVHQESAAQQVYLSGTMRLLQRHGIAAYAKPNPEQLTQDRADSKGITICMNQIVIDEAAAQIVLPPNVINWDITDIGEGNRIALDENRAVFEDEIYKEIVNKVNELVATHQLT